MNVLSIKNLTKTYPNGVKAINGINLEITNGMFGLLGANGAGKSSLMRTIASLQTPSSGSISFNDTDILKHPDAIRTQLGYLGGTVLGFRFRDFEFWCTVHFAI